MNMAEITALVMLCLVSLSVGYNIGLVDMRKKLADAERELNNRIGEALKRANHAEKNYQELSSQIKALANSGVGVDEFNKLYDKISKFVPTSGTRKA